MLLGFKGKGGSTDSSVNIAKNANYIIECLLKLSPLQRRRHRTKKSFLKSIPLLSLLIQMEKENSLGYQLWAKGSGSTGCLNSTLEDFPHF